MIAYHIKWDCHGMQVGDAVMKLTMIIVGLFSSIMSVVCLEGFMWTDRWGLMVFVVLFFVLAYLIYIELKRGTFDERSSY